MTDLTYAAKPLEALLHSAGDALLGARTPQWRPIATAPEDGTWILAYEPGQFMGTVKREDGMWTNGEYELAPTHWMPLPARPVQE